MSNYVKGRCFTDFSKEEQLAILESERNEQKIERLRKVVAMAAVAVILLLVVGSIVLIASGESAEMRW